MPTDIQTILKLEVPVIVQIGERHMALDDILALSPGAIVELNKSADDELPLLVNNKSVGTGTAVKVGEKFGIRIETVNSAEERVEAISG